MSLRRAAAVPAALAMMAITVLTAPQARAGVLLPADATNFAVLYEGGGTGNQLSTTNTIINGNIGIGAPSGTTTDFLAASGGMGALINGNVEYAAGVPAQNSIQNTTFTGTVSGNNANVQTDLNALNALNTSLGVESGAGLTINLRVNNNQTQTINASSGTLDGNGNRVFNLTSLNFGNGSTLTINGDDAGRQRRDQHLGE